MVDTLLKTFNLGRESCRNIGDLLNAVLGGPHCLTDSGLLTNTLHSNGTEDACSIFDAGIGKFDVAVVCHEARENFRHHDVTRLKANGSGFPRHVFSRHHSPPKRLKPNRIAVENSSDHTCFFTLRCFLVKSPCFFHFISPWPAGHTGHFALYPPRFVHK